MASPTRERLRARTAALGLRSNCAQIQRIRAVRNKIVVAGQVRQRAECPVVERGGQKDRALGRVVAEHHGHVEYTLSQADDAAYERSPPPWWWSGESFRRPRTVCALLPATTDSIVLLTAATVSVLGTLRTTNRSERVT